QSGRWHATLKPPAGLGARSKDAKRQANGGSEFHERKLSARRWRRAIPESADSGEHGVLPRWFGESRRTRLKISARLAKDTFSKFALSDTQRQRAGSPCSPELGSAPVWKCANRPNDSPLSGRAPCPARR